MTIRKLAKVFLDPSDARWMAFAAEQRLANIFHHPAWIKLLADCYGYRPFVVAICDADDHICAGLPMIEISNLLTGRRWVSLPFTDHCAPLYCDTESLKCLSDGLVQLSQDRRITGIELRHEVSCPPAMQSCSHVLHTVHLGPDYNAVLRGFHKEHRRCIRFAETHGVRIERGVEQQHLETFYRLHLRARRGQGIPVQPWRFFDRLGRALFEQQLGFVLLAYKDDECLAAAIFLHWQHTLTYKYSASVAEGQRLRPNNLILGTAIQWGCENGYALLDMGRTDVGNSGLRAFKAGWASEETPLTYSILSSQPIWYRPTSFMQPVIRRSPLWVCRAIGELFYRYFG